MKIMSTKLFNEYNLTSDEIPGINLSLDDFDSFEGNHQFSKEYNDKKSELLNSLDDTVHNGIFHIKIRKAVAIFALIFIVFPSTCLAAVHFYKTQVQRNNYQTDIVITPNDNNTTQNISSNFEFKPVKLSFTYLPEGSVASEGDDSKYHVPTDEDPLAKGVSPWLYKLDANEDFILSTLFTTDAEEFSVGDNRAFLITKDDSYTYNKEIYVLFEEEHYLAGAFLGYDITTEEAKKIAAGITLEETDAEYATYAYSFAEDLALQAELQTKSETNNQQTQANSQPHTYTYTSIGDNIQCDVYPYCKVTVEKVEFLDSINGLKTDCFYDIDYKKITDSNGNLIPFQRKLWKTGDGVNTIHELIEEKEVNQKLVYLTIRVTNSSGTDITNFDTLNEIWYMKEDSNKTLINCTEEIVNNYDYEPYTTHCLPVYFDASTNPTDDHLRYTTDIPAGESITYHVAYLVDEEFTDRIFYNATRKLPELVDIREK